MTALFLGAIRADKGAAELPAVVTELLSVGMAVTIAGRGSLTGPEWSPLLSDGRVRVVGLSRTLSDDEVALVLRDCDVLVAPYQDVTMSGSIVMALSAGLPVAAYSSPALRSFLPDEFLVPPGAVPLAERALSLAAEAGRWQGSIAEIVLGLDRKSGTDWSVVLGHLAEGVTC